MRRSEQTVEAEFAMTSGRSAASFAAGRPLPAAKKIAQPRASWHSDERKLKWKSARTAIRADKIFESLRDPITLYRSNGAMSIHHVSGGGQSEFADYCFVLELRQGELVPVFQPPLLRRETITIQFQGDETQRTSPAELENHTLQKADQRDRIRSALAGVPPDFRRH